MSSAVSRIASANLLSFVAILDLDQLTVLYSARNLLIRRRNPNSCDFARCLQLVLSKVFSVALGKSEDEYRAAPLSVRNYHAVPAGSHLSRPGYALLNQAAAKIGIDQASLGPFDGLTKTPVRDPFTPGKAREPSRLENPHWIDLAL